MQTREDQWLKISLDCPAPLVEPVSDALGVLSNSGVEEVVKGDGKVEINSFFRLDGGNGQQEILARVRVRVNELFHLYNQAPPRYRTSLLADEDWATSWQRFFSPFAVVPGLVIKPSWESYQPQPGEKVLEIDPGMAFGTGQHSSSRLALALMMEAMQQRPVRKVLDVGTGTGILAMAAALWGADEVQAIDNDPDAVVTARKNVEHNRLEQVVRISNIPIDRLQFHADLICANIVHDVLLDLRQDLVRLVRPGGFLVLAGILAGAQENSIQQVFARYGLQVRQRHHEQEWASLLLQSKSPVKAHAM